MCIRDSISNTLRLSNRGALNAILEKAFLDLSYDILLERCRSLKVTIAPINNLQELFQMPEAQDLILEETLPDGTISRRVKTTVFKMEWVENTRDKNHEFTNL